MLTAIPRASRSPPPRWPPSPSNVTRSMASGTTPSHPTSSRHEAVLPRQILRIRCGITASILLFVPSPSHGLISLVPWDSTASVADLETVAVNSPRILSAVSRAHGLARETGDVDKAGGRCWRGRSCGDRRDDRIRLLLHDRPN